MTPQAARQYDVQTAGGWVAALTGALSSASDPCALVLPEGDQALLSHDARSRCRVVFDGVIYGRRELEREVGRYRASARQADDSAEAPSHHPAALTDADLLRLAYEKWGDDLVRHVKGIFALVAWDAARRTWLAARDPLGSYPLFYAETAGGILFSTDARTLAHAPGVCGDLNRLALADHLCHRWPDPEETYFTAVRRVPPGHILRVDPSGRRLRRYWDPAPEGQPVEWLTDRELEGFDQVLDEAVNRCLGQGRTGIFLSGGFDSVSVAAVATDNARRLGLPAPLALSLSFPDPECNEELVQRGVAARLGLEQEMLAFPAALKGKPLLASALEMAATWPVPMFNCWNPAYAGLASTGVRRGCEVVLTGNGGDEWLGVSPFLAADLLRAGDVRGLARHLRTVNRSYHTSRLDVLRGAAWTFGMRPLLSAALGRVAPRAWRASRVRRLIESTPSFAAPDPDLRRRMDARAGRNLPDPNPRDGFYVQDGRTALDHPLMAIDLEENFEMSRRLGVRILHPYWDADLVDFLHRVPPRHLNRGGRSKGLVRYAMARRFPDLGFERHKKVTATGFFCRVLREQGPDAWRALGSAERLSDLGVADGKRVDEMMSAGLSGSDWRSLYRVWDVLALETWLRQRPTA